MADILESIVIYLNDFFKSVGYGQNLLDSLSYISVKEGIRLADMLLALETLVFKLNNLKGNLKTLCDSLDTGSTSIAIKNQFSLKDYCVYDTEACGVREMPGQPQPSVEQEEGENFSGTLDVKEESEQTSHAAVPSIHPSVAQEPENTLAENMETSSMLLENSADRLSLDVSLQPAVKEELVSFAEYNPAAVCDKNTSVTQPGTEMLDEFQQPFVKNETACLPDYTSLAVPNDNTAVTQPPAHLPEADSYVMSEVGSAAAAATLSPHMMQIQASRSEVNRRITAFIEQKRLEVDENNQREFCSGLMPEHCGPIPLRWLLQKRTIPDVAQELQTFFPNASSHHCLEKIEKQRLLAAAFGQDEASRQETFWRCISDEKRCLYKDKARLPVLKYRQFEKRNAGARKMKFDIQMQRERPEAAEAVEKKRQYWRQKQKESRDRRSAEKKQEELAKRRERYRQEKLRRSSLLES